MQVKKTLIAKHLDHGMYAHKSVIHFRRHGGIESRITPPRFTSVWQHSTGKVTLTEYDSEAAWLSHLEIIKHKVRSKVASI